MSKKNKNNFPFVSIIIPVRNEEKYIGKCLEKLTNQTYPKNRIEILVIDGMSNDETRKEIKKFNNKYPTLDVRVLNNPKIEISPALNIGIKNSRGKIIMRLDARTSVKKNYMMQCISTLEETGADNVGGVQKPISNNVTQKAIGVAMSHPFGVGNAQFRLGKKSGFVDTVYLGCFKKEIFNKIGLFDERPRIISEDSDINLRIRKSSGRIYLNKNISVHYYPRETLKKLAQLYFVYGSAKAGNFYKHKVLKFRQFIPVMFLISLTLTGVLSFFSPYFFVLFCAILMSYFITNFVSSIFLSVQQKSIKLFPSLFASFPCMHFSWALGFLVRLFQGSRHKKNWKY